MYNREFIVKVLFEFDLSVIILFGFHITLTGFSELLRFTYYPLSISAIRDLGFKS